MSARRVWDVDRDHVQASQGSVFYTYSQGQARRENIDSMVRNLVEFAGHSRKPIGFILHVVASASPPSPEDGARVTATLNKHAAKILGVATVVEAQGFAGAVLRGAVAMVFILNRGPFKTRTFEDVTHAAYWLAGLLHVPRQEILELAAYAREVLEREHRPG